jgi:hypothetical protein
MRHDSEISKLHLQLNLERSQRLTLEARVAELESKNLQIEDRLKKIEEMQVVILNEQGRERD